MKRCLVTGLRFVMVEGRYAGDCGIPIVGLWITESVFGKLVNNRYGLPVASVAPAMVGRWMHSQLIAPMAARTARTGPRTTKSCRAAPISRSSWSQRPRLASGHGCTSTRTPKRSSFGAVGPTFTVGSEKVRGHAGQVLVVPADTPHKFSTGPDGYEGVHIHANVRFITEWLE